MKIAINKIPSLKMGKILWKGVREYYCPKGWRALNVMAIASYDKSFYYLYAEITCAKNDIFVLMNSLLNIKLELGDITMLDGGYLLGEDSSFTLSSYNTNRRI